MNISRRAFSAILSLTGLAAVLGVSPWRLFGEARAQTIVEYASMTCPHCAAFTKDVFPKIKSDYVDTGKVRFIFREFPLDKIALAASAAARCIAKDDAPKYFALIDIFFKQQTELVNETLATINRVAKQAGFSEAQIKACVDDDPSTKQKIIDDLKYANETLKVNSTPFFFVNGTPIKGETSFDAFEKVIKPLLKS
ncbi:MAG: thioredoxin domain-containing protein [Afipia sp.]|nr:thioredoxin domain-containing protein [Afipia sp.]